MVQNELGEDVGGISREEMIEGSRAQPKGFTIRGELTPLIELAERAAAHLDARLRPAGCAAGMQSVLGRAQKPEYQLCAVDEEQRLVDGQDSSPPSPPQSGQHRKC